jgi:hypothetical protein
VRAFAARRSTGWTLFWDDLLASPRFLAPRRAFALLSLDALTTDAGATDPGAIEQALEGAVRGFVDE